MTAEKYVINGITYIPTPEQRVAIDRAYQEYGEDIASTPTPDYGGTIGNAPNPYKWAFEKYRDAVHHILNVDRPDN